MSVASKNLYALLGNDEEDETPRAPVKTVDKAVTRTTKRNADPEPTARLPAGGAPARRGGSGNDGAFRDRNAGSDRNRNRTTEGDAKSGARGGYAARGRGGRGGRFPRERDDRHTKGPAGANSEKQAAHGWGATEGNAELKDEQAGEAIAEGEKKEAAAEDKAEEPEEPEEKHVSYADYLAQQAEKKLSLNAGLEVRKPNEGSDKKWGQGSEVQRDDADFIAASTAKKQRERVQKQKQVVEIDQRYVEPERSTRGGPRESGPRGGGRGGPRGGRGGERGGDRGRGGNANRGGNAPRGGPRRDAASINTKDESAFPSLGGK